MRKFLYMLPVAALLAFAMQTASATAAGIAPMGQKTIAKLSATTSDVIKVRRRWRHRPSIHLHLGYRPRVRHYYVPRRRHFRRHRGCGWLHRRAHRTGSHYWWRRYNRCRWG